MWTPIRSTLDVGKTGGVADTLFGEEENVVLSKPYGVAVDKQGVIYVTEPGRVFAMDIKNKRVDFIGTQPGTGKLSFPVGISVSSDGRLFVTDIGLRTGSVDIRTGNILMLSDMEGSLRAQAGLQLMT